MKKISIAGPGSLQNFKAASRAYSDASILMHEAIARRAGLSGTDHKYLGLILQKGELTAGELAKLTGLTTGAVTGLIDRLEKKDLVKRIYAREDRRKVFIKPNREVALKLLEPLFGDLQKKTKELIATFSEPEILIIERYFRSATEVMHAITENLNSDK